MEQSNKSKRKIIIATMVFSILVAIGITYAYFSIKVSHKQEIDVDIVSEKMDYLSFRSGDPLTVSADMFSFASGENSVSGTTTASATLTANKENKNVSDSYNVYFKIIANNFMYTTEDHKTELLLEVYAPGETNLYNIFGMTPVTINNGVENVTGYDITEIKNTLVIAENYPISVDGTNGLSTTQDWTFKVQFINLDSDQSKNAGKNLESRVMLRKEKGYNIATSCGQDTMVDCISKNYTIENNLYKHDEDPSSLGARDESIRFSGAQYKVASLYSKDFKTIYDKNADSHGIIRFYCSRGANYSFVGQSCSTATYTAYYYVGNDEAHHFTTKLDALKFAVENGYLVENINNYVCFGTDDENCDNEHLYRIIGIFKDLDNPEIKRVKLIKAYYATTNELGEDNLTTNLDATNVKNYYQGFEPEIQNFYWSGSSASANTSTWSTSTLKTIGFETNYMNYLSNNNTNNKWTDMIVTTKWAVAGAPESDVLTNYRGFQDVYNVEVRNPGISVQTDCKPSDNKTTDTFKVGLMYLSDYFLSYDPVNWGSVTNTLSKYPDDSWLFTGHKEWTMSRNSYMTASSKNAKNNLYINYNGAIATQTNYSATSAVRPSFYLNENVKITSGTGEKTNPYRISLEI